MDTATVSTLVVGAVVLVIALIVVSVLRERERKERLREWATHNGWSMTLSPSVDWGRRLPGHNRRGVTLALSGTIDGRPVTIAEYYHKEETTSSGLNDRSSTSTSTRTYYYVLLVVRLSRPGPSIGVYRRRALSKFGRFLFGDRATAIGQEPFDSEYRVAAKDASVVPQVLRPALVREHIAGYLPEWSLEGQDLLTYHQGRIGDPTTIPDMFGPLLRVATLLEK